MTILLLVGSYRSTGKRCSTNTRHVLHTVHHRPPVGPAKTMHRAQSGEKNTHTHTIRRHHFRAGHAKNAHDYRALPRLSLRPLVTSKPNAIKKTQNQKQICVSRVVRTNSVVVCLFACWWGWCTKNAELLTTWVFCCCCMCFKPNTHFEHTKCFLLIFKFGN